MSRLSILLRSATPKPRRLDAPRSGHRFHATELLALIEKATAVALALSNIMRDGGVCMCVCVCWRREGEGRGEATFPGQLGVHVLSLLLFGSFIQ